MSHKNVASSGVKPGTPGTAPTATPNPGATAVTLGDIQRLVTDAITKTNVAVMNQMEEMFQLLI